LSACAFPSPGRLAESYFAALFDVLSVLKLRKMYL
jgi:hypothetical protein